MSKQRRQYRRRTLALARFFIVVALVTAGEARAGGPEYVAGSSFFDPSLMGQPVIWSMGQVNYYTDMGDLSPILPNAAANTFVANSFAQWTSVPIAALTATAAGQLAEDVNGSNIEVGANGVITAPADITPDATEKPVGIVYDFDGSVTDALLGQGAGDSSECIWNAAYGGVDNFATTANFLHAVVVINGQCALQSSQLTDLEYRLVRVLGSVIGLGWSQVSPYSADGTPVYTAALPVMHYTDPENCSYGNCLDSFQLGADDVATLADLYPASGAANSMGSIYGSIYFMDHSGNPGQPMQGVNVVACLYNTSTGQADLSQCISSVSGFLFTGNAGNPVTGWDDPLGNAYSEFGSSDQSLEGYFDLGELPVPNGSAVYQLQLQPSWLTVDPVWSAGVGPYAPTQVAPSGIQTMLPTLVTVSAGSQSEQDLVVYESAQAVAPWSASESWSAPATIPPSGDWVGSLSGYGDSAFFSIPAQANRTLSVAVTAMNEGGAASESKAEPVIGMWTLGDPYGTAPPALTTSPFNTGIFGMTRLDAQVFDRNTFVLGISDLRGDGRPDYAYHAHVLYGDSVIPARVPVGGGPITLQGVGFTPSLNVAVGNSAVPVVGTNASQVLVVAPPQVDGTQTLVVSDPVSGAFSTMTDAVTFGAAATDQFLLPPYHDSYTWVGTQSTNPVTVQVVAADGVTPVNGATVAWSASNDAMLSTCNGVASCSVMSDQGGFASTFVTPTMGGNITIEAQLAPAVYSPPQTQIVTVAVAQNLAVNIAVATPYLYIAQGATVNVPLTAKVVDQNGLPLSRTVNFVVASGAGSLSASSAPTNANGYATVTLSETNLSAGFQVNACVANTGGPCANIYGIAVAPGLLSLQEVSGGGQVVAGSDFQPLVIRVTDSSADPVLGATVLFQSMVLRPTGNDLALATSNDMNTQNGVPVILSSAQSGVQSNSSGLASFTPSVSPFSGILEVEIQASAGTTASLQYVMESFPESDFGSVAPTGSDPQAKAPPWNELAREPIPVLRQPAREMQ